MKRVTLPRIIGIILLPSIFSLIMMPVVAQDTSDVDETTCGLVSTSQFIDWSLLGMGSYDIGSDALGCDGSFEYTNEYGSTIKGRIQLGHLRKVAYENQGQEIMGDGKIVNKQSILYAGEILVYTTCDYEDIFGKVVTGWTTPVKQFDYMEGGDWGSCKQYYFPDFDQYVKHQRIYNTYLAPSPFDELFYPLKAGTWRSVAKGYDVDLPVKFGTYLTPNLDFNSVINTTHGRSYTLNDTWTGIMSCTVGYGDWDRSNTGIINSTARTVINTEDSGLDVSFQETAPDLEGKATSEGTDIETVTNEAHGFETQVGATTIEKEIKKCLGNEPFKVATTLLPDEVSGASGYPNPTGTKLTLYENNQQVTTETFEYGLMWAANRDNVVGYLPVDIQPEVTRYQAEYKYNTISLRYDRCWPGRGTHLGGSPAFVMGKEEVVPVAVSTQDFYDMTTVTFKVDVVSTYDLKVTSVPHANDTGPFGPPPIQPPVRVGTDDEWGARSQGFENVGGEPTQGVDVFGWIDDLFGGFLNFILLVAGIIIGIIALVLIVKWLNNPVRKAKRQLKQQQQIQSIKQQQQILTQQPTTPSYNPFTGKKLS